MMLLISAILRHLYLIATFRHDGTGLHLENRSFAIFALSVSLVQAAVLTTTGACGFAEAVARFCLANAFSWLLWRLLGIERCKQAGFYITALPAVMLLAALAPWLGYPNSALIAISYQAVMLIALVRNNWRSVRAGNNAG